MAECRVSYDDNGVAVVLDRRGNPSKLYDRILNITEDQDTAVNTWAAAMLPESGLAEESTSIEDLLSFMDSTAAMESKLSPEELSMVKNTMAKNNYSSLSEFNKALSVLFKPNGYIQLPERDTSGMYTQDDLRNLNMKEVNSILQKIEGHLAVFEEEYTEPYGVGDLYTDTSKKNILGMSEKLTQPEVMSLLLNEIQDFSNESEIEYAIKSSPYEGFADRFDNDSVFRDEVIKDFSELRRIPTLSIVAGELTDKNTRHYTTIKNTILSGLSTTELEADMEYLASIPDHIWYNTPEAARGVVKEVESTLAKMNIDVVGLSNHIGSKEVIIDLLNESFLMVKNPTHGNIAAFTNKLQQLIPQDPSSIVELVNEEYDGYNVVNMETLAPESELFNRYGLIKIGEDLYHKVDQEADINVLIDYLSKQYVEGEYSLPKEFIKTTDLTNKVGVLEDINTFIASHPEIEGLESKMLYTAYKEIFGHSEQQLQTSETTHLSIIRTDEDYLKTDFITDFYGYILEEKLKDSPLYRNTLSHFQITDKDISLKGRPSSIAGLKFEQELSDYIRLKRGSKMRYLLEDITADPTFEDLVAVNFPETISELDEEFMMHGKNFVVLPSTPRTYVKVDGNIFRKSGSNPHSDVFSRITTKPNTVYLTNNMDFSTDMEEVVKQLNLHVNIETPVTPEGEAIPFTEIGEEIQAKESIFRQTRNIEDYSIILDSQLKVVDLYNENERQSIVNKIDECGG